MICSHPRYETYVDRLAALRVLVKARNFCVFQGDVDSIACRQGVQLTKLIEQVSGSDLLKEECAWLGFSFLGEGG